MKLFLVAVAFMCQIENKTSYIPKVTKFYREKGIEQRIEDEK